MKLIKGPAKKYKLYTTIKKPDRPSKASSINQPPPPDKRKEYFFPNTVAVLPFKIAVDRRKLPKIYTYFPKTTLALVSDKSGKSAFEVKSVMAENYTITLILRGHLPDAIVDRLEEKINDVNIDGFVPGSAFFAYPLSRVYNKGGSFHFVVVDDIIYIDCKKVPKFRLRIFIPY